MKKTTILFLTLGVTLLTSACSTNSGTNTDVPDTITSEYAYSEHLGTWYGFGTDGDDAQFEINISSNDSDTAYVSIDGWGTNHSLDKTDITIVYLTENEAEEITDTQHKRKFYFKNEYGKETLEIKFIDTSSGNQIAESIFAGRYSDRSTAFGEIESKNIQNNDGYINEKNSFQQRYDQLNAKAIKDAPQQEMNTASGELYAEWDILLNDIYNYLKTIKSSSEFEIIKNDEIAWISKKETAVEKSRNEYAGGSMAPLAANTTAIEYTKNRCDYLISLIN